MIITGSTEWQNVNLEFPNQTFQSTNSLMQSSYNQISLITILYAGAWHKPDFRHVKSSHSTINPFHMKGTIIFCTVKIYAFNTMPGQSAFAWYTAAVIQ